MLQTGGAGADWHRPASVGFSAPPRARTEDPLIKRQHVTRRKPKKCKAVTSSHPIKCSAGCSDQQGEGGITDPDPDLKRVCDNWLSLPNHIKAAILALVDCQRRGSS